MAMTHDYLDYLNEKVGIAPANSQEELQAAQTISELMAQHNVEPRIEEFNAPALAGVVPAALSVAMFLGVLVSGLGFLPLTVIGLVLAIVPAAIAVLRLFGHEVSLGFGPPAQSQNVVAIHRATGPLVTKGNRTIVVVAHYDSPRENFLLSTPVAPYLPLVTKLSVPCSYVTAVCALLQLLGFIPDVVRIVLWLVGIVAALPALLVAVGVIAQRMAACTLGANDNKSSVAAMLGVLENVRPSGMTPRERPAAPEPATAPEDGTPEPAAADVTAAQPVYEEVVGVRHGAEVLRSLGMLPEDCEIEYVAPALVAPGPAAPMTESADTEEPGSTIELSVPSEPSPTGLAEVSEPAVRQDATEPEPTPEEGVSQTAPQPRVTQDSETTLLATPDETADSSVADDGSEADVTAPSEPLRADVPHESPSATARLSVVADDTSRSADERGTSGHAGKAVNRGDSDATQAARPVARTAAPTDPEWGKTSYRPQLSSVARRASLFDLPDPSESEVDPFATDPHAPRVQSPKVATPRTSDAPASVAPTPAVAPEPIETISSIREEAAPARHNPLSGLLDRIKGLRKSSPKDEAPSTGGWLGADDQEDSEEDGGSMWRGGAAPRSGLRLVEDEEAPSEEELREAVLKLGDDALVSHDIWFVALGASSLDHAGMRAFLQQHRSEVRGCFVINLDCVGAGDLCLLKNEGLEVNRRADRRISRLLSGAANDLHMTLDQRPCDWQGTDATVAMRSSLRSVTIRGVDANGLAALSQTADDLPENVSGDQAAQVAELVTEMIRRS
ncbi:hypothetical protein [Olsenella profusa]|uniref:Peptidase M28 domain-containing protein n=1 Tax=Olsenella profusa TaxID=138595 RepID=A0ABS2F0D8_9ACTN|nr:hypothetical protein [Olsenella profusa]MBM6774444.1 hypothetical protein [Olsenella profusa]